MFSFSLRLETRDNRSEPEVGGSPPDPAALSGPSSRSTYKGVQVIPNNHTFIARYKDIKRHKEILAEHRIHLIIF